jgi:hypothetical protein
MFFVNFWHYYMLFSAAVHTATRKDDLNLLAALLYILSTRVSKIHAHAFLICIASHWPWMIADTSYWLQWDTLCLQAEVTHLRLIRYAKKVCDHHIAKDSNVSARISHAPQFLAAVSQKKCTGNSRKYSMNQPWYPLTHPRQVNNHISGVLDITTLHKIQEYESNKHSSNI